MTGKRAPKSARKSAIVKQHPYTGPVLPSKHPVTFVTTIRKVA